jgi:uncharacterized membrane protein
MNSLRKSKSIHVFFNFSVIAKGIDGVLEIVGGILLFFTSPNNINMFVRILTQHELSEDPKDLIATYLLKSTHNLSKDVTVFAAMYLLWHGMVKVGLVAGLLFKRRWAYPAAIIAFFLFVIYQSYRFTHTHSPTLLALTVLDIFVIILTWIEYKRLKAIHGFAGSTR